MTMSWSIGAREDHTWIQEEDTERREAGEKEGKEGERQKNRSEIQKYKCGRLLETELRNKKGSLSQRINVKRSHSMLVAQQMTRGSWQAWMEGHRN